MARLPTFKLEKTLIARGLTRIAGVDEAGCGAWAGPVFAAAVILPTNSRLGLIRDSKTLSESQRERLVEDIKIRSTAWSVGFASPEEIDELNIRQAAFLAMTRALDQLADPEHVLVDGFMIPGLSTPCTRVVKGDRKVKSIAAASILAKVHRDLEMEKLDKVYSGYGFAKHKGYGVPAHQKALCELGPCPIHRMSYKPILDFLAGSF